LLVRQALKCSFRSEDGVDGGLNFLPVEGGLVAEEPLDELRNPARKSTDSPEALGRGFSRAMFTTPRDCGFFVFGVAAGL